MVQLTKTVAGNASSVWTTEIDWKDNFLERLQYE